MRERSAVPGCGGTEHGPCGKVGVASAPDPPYGARMPWTSMLRCSDGSYSVGSTWDLEHRVEQHQLGRGAEYTKRRRPVTLVYAAEFERIEEAFQWEKRLQGWGRAKREALIRVRRSSGAEQETGREAAAGGGLRGVRGGLEARCARTSTTGKGRARWEGAGSRPPPRPQRLAGPAMRGVWNVPPKTRSDAPTRSRYGVMPPAWKG
ncbi:GIY-YIG nuclease family protein [Amnibacterium sp.]|uniref:GIY-YIG nuclease family protein n=1 Tax=Amnibacterium sp. TaxID=1872496 RepID=UPI003F7BF9AF